MTETNALLLALESNKKAKQALAEIEILVKMLINSYEEKEEAEDNA